MVRVDAQWLSLVGVAALVVSPLFLLGAMVHLVRGPARREEVTPTLAGIGLYGAHVLLMLAAAPLLGLAYVIFLPLIGFGMVAYLLGHKAVQLATGTAAEAVRVLQPGWAPALAFLSRNKPAKVDQAAKDAEPDAWKEQVEKKLDETDHESK